MLGLAFFLFASNTPLEASSEVDVLGNLLHTAYEKALQRRKEAPGKRVWPRALTAYGSAGHVVAGVAYENAGKNRRRCR